uniref:Ig-like domain-containing protein n=1 Tax=Astyanax mexicanus TaxID=7994 RepID=A0A8B9GW27_ASTMX
MHCFLSGLQVEVPERVMEGDKVTLTCKTTCGLTGSTSFTWFRNGTTLSSRTDPLYLKTVSREDAGRYSCGPTTFWPLRLTLSISSLNWTLHDFTTNVIPLFQPHTYQTAYIYTLNHTVPLPN